MNAEEKDIKIEEFTEDFSELCDPNYPLLQRLRESCPGTYKHSQTLVNMVESVSMSLGLDANFMKVICLYHDIGKIYASKYFSENQMEEEDAHKELDPWISAQIISRHVSDGVALLLNDQKFSRKIIEVISQHHGNSIIKYFFEKSGSDLDDLYRYNGAKPKCIESALLMIADCIEAKSRSFVQSGKYDSIDVVNSVVNDLLADGQLNDVYCKLGDLNKIKEGLSKELKSMYVKRVDYDRAKKEKNDM